MKLKDIDITVDFDGILSRLNYGLNNFKQKQLRDTVVIIATVLVCVFVEAIALLWPVLFGDVVCTLKERSEYGFLACLFILAFVSVVFIPDSANRGDLNRISYAAVHDILKYSDTHSTVDPFSYLIAMPYVDILIPNWELIRAEHNKTVSVSALDTLRKLRIDCSNGMYELTLSQYDFECVISGEGCCKLFVAWDSIQLM